MDSKVFMDLKIVTRYILAAFLVLTTIASSSATTGIIQPLPRNVAHATVQYINQKTQFARTCQITAKNQLSGGQKNIHTPPIGKIIESGLPINGERRFFVREAQGSTWENPKLILIPLGEYKSGNYLLKEGEALETSWSMDPQQKGFVLGINRSSYRVLQTSAHAHRINLKGEEVAQPLWHWMSFQEGKFQNSFEGVQRGEILIRYDVKKNNKASVFLVTETWTKRDPNTGALTYGWETKPVRLIEATPKSKRLDLISFKVLRGEENIEFESNANSRPDTFTYSRIAKVTNSALERIKTLKYGNEFQANQSWLTNDVQALEPGTVFRLSPQDRNTTYRIISQHDGYSIVMRMNLNVGGINGFENRKVLTVHDHLSSGPGQNTPQPQMALHLFGEKNRPSQVEVIGKIEKSNYWNTKIPNQLVISTPEIGENPNP